MKVKGAVFKETESGPQYAAKRSDKITKEMYFGFGDLESIGVKICFGGMLDPEVRFVWAEM